MRYVTFFVETYDNVLEMSKDVFLAYHYLSSTWLVMTIELKTDIRADDFVLGIIEALEHENLSILDISQSISSNQSNPVSILFTIRHDALDCFTIVGSHGVSVGWCSCDFLEWLFRW